MVWAAVAKAWAEAMKQTPLKRKTPLRQISSKRAAELVKLNALVERLRNLCNNRSELSGLHPDWQSSWKVEPHHIQGRIGNLLLSPLNIILVTRDEHRAIQEYRSPYSVRKLLEIVKVVRERQGFEY